MVLPVQKFDVLTPEQANPLVWGFGKGADIQQTFANAIRQQMESQKLKEQMPYVGPQAQADLAKTQLENQYYGPLTESQIALHKAQAGLAGAETDVQRLKVKYPGLGEGGATGTLAFANYLSDNPDVVSRLKNQSAQQQSNSVNGTLNQTTQPSGNYGIIPGIDNPIDFLMQNATTDLRYKQALMKNMEANLKARSFEKLPMSEKSFALAQARSFGYTAQEAIKAFQNGDSIGDLAERKGYDKNDSSGWPVAQGAPTTANQTRMQRSNMALAGINAVDPLLQSAYGEYATRFKGVSPLLIKDMVKGENEDRQAEIFAAYMLTPEINALRINALGGNVGIGAMKHLEDVAYQKINTLGLSPSSPVYLRTLQKVKQYIEKINKAENQALYKQQSQLDEQYDQNNQAESDSNSDRLGILS